MVANSCAVWNLAPDFRSDVIVNGALRLSCAKSIEFGSYFCICIYKLLYYIIKLLDSQASYFERICIE